MDYTNPLDFMLTENTISRPLFGESSMNEITLPGDEDITGEPFDEMGDESNETPGEEALEHSSDPRDIISGLMRKISDLKEEITSKLKDLYPEDKDSEIAEALDDATSALDLATHHLEDVDNSLSGESNTEETEEMPLTDDSSDFIDDKPEDGFNA